jgi:hypothetical protein
MSLAPRLRTWGASLRSWGEGKPFSLFFLTLIILVAAGGAAYGIFIADPDIRVQNVDAGPVSEFAIGQVNPLPGQNVYVVGLENGRIRAVDGLVEGSLCAVQWLPEDERTRAENPLGAKGAYFDPCSGALWTIEGNAFSGADEPLRTFQVDYDTNGEGVQHVWVEVLGDRNPEPRTE